MTRSRPYLARQSREGQVGTGTRGALEARRLRGSEDQAKKCKDAKVKSKLGPGIGLGLDHDTIVDRLISWPVGKGKGARGLLGWFI